jgi:hypothetical protein
LTQTRIHTTVGVYSFFTSECGIDKTNDLRLGVPASR